MTDDGALLLARAIIVQQAKDYKAALRKCKKNGTQSSTGTVKCEKFFRSAWFTILTRGKIDGEYIIEKLREEVEEEQGGKQMKILHRKKE